MSARTLLAIGLTLGFTLACTGGEEAPVEEPKEMSPDEKAANVGKAVSGDAAKAEEALKEAGMSADEFDTLMYEIAGDADRSKKYIEAAGYGK